MDWAFLPANRKSADYEALLMNRDGDISCLAAPRPTWVLLFYLEISKKEWSCMEEMKSQDNLIYGVDDNPAFFKKLLFGLQHVFAAFSGIVVVPLVIAGALGFDSQMTTALISASILAAGVATIIQARGVGPVGSRVACIMGTDFTFVSPAISVGSSLGMAGIVGATILGSLFEVVLSFFIKP